ncbi:hypothetical protein AB4Y96_14570 [Phyllobacterium sp. TAF24]|uniref:hypothetical protein n=1 Tax=Phyllobacterium sp. TAF24 TaxID=3233068 RepID=UPI003F9622B1
MAGRSRGAETEAAIDRQYPYQVALLAIEVSYRFDNVDFLSRRLGCYRLNHSYYDDGEGFVIYCFPEKDEAEIFLKAFDGHWITPEQRKKSTWKSPWVRQLVGRYG